MPYQNTRSFCDLPGNDHALVPSVVEVRDNLGPLAVQVHAAKENLATMDYNDMIKNFYEIVCDLHQAFDQERTNLHY